MGSKKSSSTSTTSSNLFDQRSITSIDDRDTSSTSNLSWDTSDRSTTNTTSSYALDSSNRSTTSYNIAGADAEAINRQNTELLADFAGDQTDAIRAIAQMQASGVNAIGGAFTDVASLASNNTARAWTHTIDAGAELLGRVVDATRQSSDSARLVAQAAIASYQPAENKQADTLKYTAIAAAAAIALIAFK